MEYPFKSILLKFQCDLTISSNNKLKINLVKPQSNKCSLHGASGETQLMTTERVSSSCVLYDGSGLFQDYIASIIGAREVTEWFDEYE